MKIYVTVSFGLYGIISNFNQQATIIFAMRRAFTLKQFSNSLEYGNLRQFSDLSWRRGVKMEKNMSTE